MQGISKLSILSVISMISRIILGIQRFYINKIAFHQIGASHSTQIDYLLSPFKQSYLLRFVTARRIITEVEVYRSAYRHRTT